MGITKQTQDELYPVRVYAGDKERIDTFKRALGLSSRRDLLFVLMEYYERGHEEGEKITLSMYCDKECSKSVIRTDPKKLVFCGKTIHLSDKMYSSAITPEVARAIEIHYKYKIEPDWIYDIEKIRQSSKENSGRRFGPFVYYNENDTYYWFYHCLDVYFHEKNQMYLVHEKATIRQNPLKEHDSTKPLHEPFDLQRCKFVKDYGEILYYFSRCADSENLKQICLAMAENIGTDYTQLDKLF